MYRNGLYLGKVVSADFSHENIEDLPSCKDYRFTPDGSCFIYGRPGTGKTVLCKVLIEESILAGHACLVIDPKGDLAQLAWPYEIGSLFERDAKKLALYEPRYKAFDTLHRQKEFAEKIDVQLFDHNYRPSEDMIKRMFTPRDMGKTSLTVVSLNMTESQRKKNDCFEALMTAIRKSQEALGKIRTPKALFIDEAYRFSRRSSRSAYNLLNNMVRETCRLANIKLMISSQSQEDFGQDFIRGGNFKHFFSFEKPAEKYKCQVFTQTELEVIPHNEIYPFRLLPRWTLTVHRENPINQDEFEKTMRFWESRKHSVCSIISDVDGEVRSPVTTIDDIDFAILNCLNEVPISLKWNPGFVQKILGRSLSKHKKILEELSENKELRNYGHYYIWLDYEKIGFPITAFFVSKGNEGWEKDKDQIRSSPEAVEFFEIKGPQYWDVNLLGKFRFRNMRHYFDYVSRMLLKVSKRGMSVEERFTTYLEKYKEESKVKGPRVRPEIPSEQVVSGVISNRVFSEHPGCYLQNHTFQSMTTEQHVELRRLLEIEDKGIFTQDPNSHQIHMDSLNEAIQKLPNCRDLKYEQITERLCKLVEIGAVKGVYMELPWDALGYETAYYLGQFDFQKDIVQQVSRIADDHHEIQEVHTIVGPYDVLAKVRIRKDFGEPEQIRVSNELKLENLIFLKVTRELKSGFRFRGLV